jgi:hypothetical protein
VGASQAIGAGAAAGAIGTAAGTAAGVAATAPALPLLKATTESIEKILEALTRFFVLMRAREDAWLLRTMRGRAPQEDILGLIAEENARAAEFQRRVLARVRRDAARALNLPEEKQEAAVEALLRREQTYARQRSEAMAVRALAALDRTVLRKLPPPPGGEWAGAFWKLDPTVNQHTADCIAMGGRFWPWEALAVLFPPTHPGCRCSLHSWAEAVEHGWLRPSAHRWLPIDDMVRKAHAAAALLHEGDARDLMEAVIEAGLADRVGYCRALVEVA